MRVTHSSREPLLDAGTNPVDVSIAQMLALATLAKIKFDVADGRLVMFSSHANWKLWMPVRAYLDEIGVEAIVDYFARTTSEDRAVLSAPA
jgi:hypothetical protein